MKRRAFLTLPLLGLAPPAIAVEYPAVVPGHALGFPRDRGSHPDFRTEWWYVTGRLADRDGAPYGVQVTFFRNRPGVAEDNPSAFAPRQLLFAHAALADPRLGRLRHDQRMARAGFGLAGAAEGETRAWIDDWSLAFVDGAYVAKIAARDFALRLSFAPTQPPLLEGEGGYSRKGPEPRQASYYVSEPQLAVRGTITVEGQTIEASGTAWLDHEWSSEYLAPNASGWDWMGINLADGGALMAFRIRQRTGGTLWAGGSLRAKDGDTRVFAPSEIEFTPTRTWRSPRTGISYPIATTLRAGAQRYALEPLMADQELDASVSTGTVYWEGAVRALSGEAEVGRGYLELTGYGAPLRL
jgi:predicted secreted hydrolase